MDLAEFFKSHQVILAPMAGVTDEAMRALCLEQGADLTYTEMVSAKALSFANEKTRHLLTMAPGEARVAVQMFGHEPDVMAREACWIVEVMGDSLAYLDINMGCPARKIAGKGDGSALMKDPELAAKIVEAVSRAVESADVGTGKVGVAGSRGNAGVESNDEIEGEHKVAADRKIRTSDVDVRMSDDTGKGVPVTCKFRRGFRMGEETAPDFARRMEQAGAAAVAVHGRFAQQMYAGEADWDVIARVREAVGVPVIGNGDITSGTRACEMVAQTGCDAVMVARAAEGNPWIFSEVKAALAGEPLPNPPTFEERIAMARRHAELLTHREGRNIVRMRKHAAWYMHGLPGASVARGKFNQCVTLEDFNAVFDEVLTYARAFYA